MKKLCSILVISAAISLSLSGQASTLHNNYTVEDFVNYENGWVAYVTINAVINQVRKELDNGDTVIKYVNNYRSTWEYHNLNTGERVKSPVIENVNGVYTFGQNHFTNDRHWVFHYIKSPIFGSYHINFNLLWEFNPDTGFMEVFDIQNEWSK